LIFEDVMDKRDGWDEWTDEGAGYLRTFFDFGNGLLTDSLNHIIPDSR